MQQAQTQQLIDERVPVLAIESDEDPMLRSCASGGALCMNDKGSRNTASRSCERRGCVFASEVGSSGCAGGPALGSLYRVGNADRQGEPADVGGQRVCLAAQGTGASRPLTWQAHL